MINQVLSLVGAALILGAYLAFQRGWLLRSDRSYHALNFVGGALLSVVAVADGRIGFIILEGAWTLLSVPGTLRPPPASVAANA